MKQNKQVHQFDQLEAANNKKCLSKTSEKKKGKIVSA